MDKITLFENVLNKFFKDEPSSKGIVAADIDNTLLHPDPDVIGVWKIKDGERKWITTFEYDSDPDLLNDNPEVEWDYTEFYDPKKVRDSIIQGSPLLSNLTIIDEYLQRGYDFAFLTARSCEDVIKEALDIFIEYRDSDNKLKKLEKIYKRGFSAAVSDDRYMQVFENLNAAERKAKVLKYLCDKYEHVVFIDDSPKNIRAAKELNLENLEIIVAERE